MTRSIASTAAHRVAPSPPHGLPPRHSQPPRSALEVIGLAVMALAVIAIYADTLTSPFVFDDEHNIQNNIYIRLERIDLPSLWSAAFDSPLKYRPFSNLGFALNYYLHRENVVGYHAVNLLVHIAAAVLFYLLAKATLTTAALGFSDKKAALIAYLAAVLWAVHPLQTQSVSYIVQRMNSQSALFFVLALLLYVRFRGAPAGGRRRLLLSGCVLSGILAVGSKEIAATLPVFILLYEWYFFQNLEGRFLRRHAAVILLGLALAAAIGLLFLQGEPIGTILSGYALRDFTLSQRLLTQPRVVVLYLSLIFWPHPSRLNLDHDFPVSVSLLRPTETLGAIALIGLLLTAAVILAKRERLLSFGILWFFGNLVIESSVIGLEMVFEHRVYLPSMFLILALVALALKRIKPAWLAVAPLTVAALTGCWWTYQRNAVWSDPVAFWEDSARKSPRKVRPHNNLGTSLARKQEYGRAVKAFEAALAIDPEAVRPHYNLAAVLAATGDYETAAEHLREALRIAPANHLAHNNLALVYMHQDRLEDAERHLRTAIRIRPDYETGYNNLGVLMRREGNLEEAVSLFRTAIRLYPEYAEAHNNLGYALRQMGDLREALHHFEQALALVPNYDIARENLQETQALIHASSP